MKKARAAKASDDLRREYDLSKLGPMVRGKYYREAAAGTNLILIEPELARVFPDSESVNRALRLLVKTAEASAVPGANAPPTSACNPRVNAGDRAVIPSTEKPTPGSRSGCPTQPSFGWVGVFFTTTDIAPRS